MLISGGCGRTASPCPRTHSTSRPSSSRRVGQKKHSLHSPTIPPSGGFGPAHSYVEGRFGFLMCTIWGDSSSTDQKGFFSLLLVHRNSALVFLMHGAGEIMAVTQDFWVREPFMLRAVCLWVPYRFWWYVYVPFPIVVMYVVYCGLHLCFPLSMLGAHSLPHLQTV